MEDAYQGSNKPSYWGTVGFIDHTNNYFDGGQNEKRVESHENKWERIIGQRALAWLGEFHCSYF